MALIQILPTTVKERQFPSFLACVYNSIPSPKKTLPASAFFFSKMWTFILDLILHFRSCKNKPVIFQTITRYHFLLLLFYPLFFWKILWVSCGSIFSATLALLTYQTHFWLISLIASVSLITCISIISIKSAPVLIYFTFYKYLSLILHIKVSKNYRCLPEFGDSETAASSSACSFDLGRAPVLKPQDELPYLWEELFHSWNIWKNN